MEDNPEVLIVVLNYNGIDYTEECLNSIKNNLTYSNFQVLVVDNGSEEFPEDEIKDRGIQTMVNQRNLGFDIGMNKAICNNPNYDYYLLLNNDTEVHSGLLESLIDTSKNFETGLVAPKLIYPDGELQCGGFKLPEIDPIFKEEIAECEEEVFEVDGFLGAAFLIESNIINEIGYLDEVFSPGNYEEWDYLYRAKCEGYSAYIDTKAVVTHKEKKTKEDIPSRFVYFMERKNSLKYWVMNGSKLDLISQGYKSLKHLGAGIIGYKSNYTLEVLRSFYEAFLDLPHLLKRRYGDNFVPSYYFEGKKDYSKRY